MADVAGVDHEGRLFFGSALILAIASSRVPSAFGLAGLSKPTWLSLICRKVRPAGFLGGLRLADQAQRVGNAAGNGPEHAGACPGHAFENLAPADAVGAP
jgi:hypothetical protein